MGEGLSQLCPKTRVKVLRRVFLWRSNISVKLKRRTANSCVIFLLIKAAGCVKVERRPHTVENVDLSQLGLQNLMNSQSWKLLSELTGIYGNKPRI